MDTDPMMVAFTELLDADPTAYDRDADDWEGQAAVLEEYLELAGRFVDALAGWEGLTGILANRRAAELAAVFGDTPRRFRTTAAALRRTGRELKAARELAAEAEDEARRHGYHITDECEVLPGVSPLQAAIGVRPGPTPGGLPGEYQARIQAKAGSATRRATRADEELQRALPLIQEGLSWEGDNPDVLSADEAATLLRRAATGDQEALARLRGHHELFSDSYFAKELAEILGPKGFTQLPGRIQHSMNGVDSEEGRALLGMLSDTLAAATDPHNPAWEAGGEKCPSFLEDLKEQGRAPQTGAEGLPYDGYWGLGQVMEAGDGRPPYSEAFLGDVGNDMVAWDQENSASPNWPYSSGPYALEDSPGPLDHPGEDPLAGLMNAAGSSPEGAQALLEGAAAGRADDAGDQTNNLDYLMSVRHWPDAGDALGGAIEAAGDPRSDNPRAAARIATQTVENIGAAMQRDPEHVMRALGGLEDSIGRMLGDRIEDVNSSINGSDIPGVPGRFTHADIADALKFATKDQDGYDALVSAELGHTQRAINEGAAAGADQLKLAARDGATVLGVINAARIDGLDDDALERDQAYGVLARYAQGGLGLLSLATGPLAPVGGAAGLAAREVTGKIFEIAAPHAQAEVRTHQATYTDQAKTALSDMVARSVADHRLYSDQNSPSAWSADPRNKGMEPFTDDQGNVLSWDKLAANNAAYASFDSWVRGTTAWDKGANDGVNDGYDEGFASAENAGWYHTEQDKNSHERSS